MLSSIYGESKHRKAESVSAVAVVKDAKKKKEKKVNNAKKTKATKRRRESTSKDGEQAAKTHHQKYKKNAPLMGAQIMLSKAECARGTVQKWNINNAALRDVQL